MLTAYPLIVPFPASHSVIKLKLYIWPRDRSQGQNLQFHANPATHTAYVAVCVHTVANVLVRLHIIMQLMRWLLNVALSAHQNIKRGGFMLSTASETCGVLSGKE